MAQTIKIIIALAVLALLPACWGLKRPPPVTVTIAEICGGNPFNAACDATYEVARIVKITECIEGGEAATTDCAGAVGENSCIRDPFMDSCADDDSFSSYILRARNERATYCVADNANATLCASVAGSTQFDMACLNSPTGSPIHATCASRPRVVSACDDAPFTSPGCGNVRRIEALRIAHCEDSATAWDDGCVETTYTGAEAARNTACLTHGINVATGGHADCAERENVLLACSETSPFAYDVCDEVEEIDVKRTTFCLETSANGGENPFNARCETDGTHGDVSGAQEASCLANVDADDGCVALITQTCTDTPLAGVSCAGLDGHPGFLNTFCSAGNNVMLGGCATTPARLSACATGMLGISECDTDMIAPKVCASSGDNANPFVAFCSDATMIGGSDAIGVIRQAVVTLCFDGANPNMAVCQNTDTVVSALTTGPTRCELIGNIFENRCDYTEYEPRRIGFCTTRDTAWNAGCDNNAHGNPTTARNSACLFRGINTSLGGHADCRTNSHVDANCTDATPFAHTGCNTFQGINTRRATYCNMAINAWKSDCTGGSFGGTHNPTTAQRDACVAYGTDTNVGGHGTCNANPEAKSFCETNDPFATANAGCEDLTDFLMVVRTYCTTRMDQDTCKANYADWTGSTFTTQFPLATAPVSTHTTNRFLSGLTATALTDFTLLTTAGTNGQKANTTTSLTLADPVHGFDGQADDGLAFYGVDFSGNIRYYAGIYTDTDVGLPLTNGVQNAVWRAWMRTSGKDPENEAFTLTVSFTESSKAGTLKAFFQSTSGTNTALYYDIDGTFNIHGVITGNVAIGIEDSSNSGSLDTGDDEYTSGGLTGLIGAEGVVAAFVSNTSTTTTDGGTNPFVGGFVGIPALADHDAFSHHYKTQLNTVLTTGEVAFVEGMAENLVNTGLTFTTADGEFDTFAVRFNDVSGGDDGFALMFGQTAGDENRYRAGLLSGTNLGAPLSGTETDVNWTGKLHVSRHLNGTTNMPMDVSLTLAVDFSAGTIETDNAVTTATGETIAIIGRFRSGSNNLTLPLGVLGGTVTYNVNTTEHADLPLIGLIGVDGAIGVFHGGSAIPMVGGFWVNP